MSTSYVYVYVYGYGYGYGYGYSYSYEDDYIDDYEDTRSRSKASTAKLGTVNHTDKVTARDQSLSAAHVI
ncbi:hypothetical protein KEM52_003329, partial [Ascosphaera acerosa]